MSVLDNVKTAASRDLHYNVFDSIFRTKRFWNSEKAVDEKVEQILEILGLKEYSELKKNYRPSFIDKVNEWKHKTGGLTQTEYNEYQNMLRRNKECYSKGESLF